MVDLDATQLHPVLLLMVEDMVVLSPLGPLQLFLDTGRDFSNKHCCKRYASIDLMMHLMMDTFYLESVPHPPPPLLLLPLLPQSNLGSNWRHVHCPQDRYLIEN